MALVWQACLKGLYKMDYDALENMLVEARTACDQARKESKKPAPTSASVEAPLRDVTLAALNISPLVTRCPT